MIINREQKPVELDIVATGHKIKLLMEEREIAIKDISKAMNVSFQAVYRWQKGETLPTISNMFILGQLLQVNMDDMLVAKENKCEKK